METFKERLAHILRSKNLTGTQFAGLMGIQPSNVSHLLSGRNNPSIDFLIKLKETFPEYSFDWIILGKKPITIVEPLKTNEQPAELSQTDNKINQQLDLGILDDDTVIPAQESPIDENPDETLNADKNIDIIENHDFKRNNDIAKKIIIMYDDNTFEMFNVRK